MKIINNNFDTKMTTTVRSSPEDEFYNNLTLGLIKFLSNIPRVSNVTFQKQQPCERNQINMWEQRHNVYLPDDMKRFYLSTDGFTLHWSYQYSPNDIRRVGFIHFPHLLQIILLRDYLELISPTGSSIPSPNRSKKTKDNEPALNSRSKIFELSAINDVAKVCLIYETIESINPKIYLLEIQSAKWQFLADTFTEYLRMGIAHLGLPYWELCFAQTCALPSWAEQLFLLLAPHLLEKNELRRSRILPTVSETPIVYNQIDPQIFRTKTKCSKPTNKTK